MSAITVFYQQCPVCGRNLRIPTKFFGRQMTCSHCEGEFRAGKEELPEAPPANESSVQPSLHAPGVYSHPQLGEV